MSKVMSNGNERIKFPINEPAPRARRSRRSTSTWISIDGPGVQHLALATDDIIATVTALRDRGVEFLTAPTTYYDELQGRVGKIDEPIDAAARSSASWWTAIRTAICCRSSRSRWRIGPTLFYEIIQRKGARSFGKGNFKALFEAIEREQAAAREISAMPIYHTLGEIPKKRHTAFREPDGGIYAEELMGHEGFTGTSSLLYHSYPPTTVKSARRLREITCEADAGTVRFDTGTSSRRACKKGGSPTLDRIPLLFNQRHRDALRRAGRERRALLPERPGRRAGVRREGQRGAGIACSATCRSARATTWSSIAASCTAGSST